MHAAWPYFTAPCAFIRKADIQSCSIALECLFQQFLHLQICSLMLQLCAGEPKGQTDLIQGKIGYFVGFTGQALTEMQSVNQSTSNPELWIEKVIFYEFE